MAVEKILVPDIGDVDEVEVVEVLVEVGAELAVDTRPWSRSSGATRPMTAITSGSPQPESPAPEPAEEEPATPETAPAEAAPSATRQAAAKPEPAAPAPRSAAATLPSIDEASFARAYASPAVRRFARELGVDLGRVEGTGRNGRIVKADVKAFVKQVMAAGPQTGPSAGSVPGIDIPEMPQIDFSRFGEIERRPMSRIQKISGPSLHRSWLHVPHVTQHDEADITDLEAFRQENKAKAKEEGFSLTPLAFVMKAVVAALEEYPTINASIDVESGELIVKKYHHLGVAVDTPDGLVVPVIRDVDCKGVMDLARELAEVSAAARDGKLKIDQLQGASFTITSLGGIGGTAFTPIVNAPEVGILGVSRSYLKPVWKEGEDGGAFVPRLMLPLSFSYDHRAVDGATAVRFTTFLAQELGDIRRLVL